MRHLSAALAVLVFAGASATHAAEVTFQKTLTATGQVALNICSNSGQIHIAGVDGSKVQISADIHKNNWHTMPSADQMKQVAANPPVAQSGNTVKIGNNDTCGASVLPGVAIDYEITIPKNSTVMVKIGEGAVRAESINGFVRAATGSGDITVNGIGDQSMLSTGSGNLVIEAAHGMLLAKTGSGNITIQNSDLKDAQFKTGSGNITGTALTGGLRASTGNGALSMAGNPTGDWALRTGNGAIQLHADPGAKYELDAGTGSGTIDSSLPAPVSGHVTDGVLRGPVNGGGPNVKLYTGSGNITLQ